MQNAIDTARGLGTTVVVSAGNSNANASNFTPASCSGVVTVASVNRAGSRAFYSNFGGVVNVAAPGGDTSGHSSNGVLSTLNNGSQGPAVDSYAFYQGTSMAAPHVTGVAALLYALYPSVTPEQVNARLRSTARSFPGSCSNCGSGIVDAAAAVEGVGAPPEIYSLSCVEYTGSLAMACYVSLAGGEADVIKWSIDGSTVATSYSGQTNYYGPCRAGVPVTVEVGNILGKATKTSGLPASGCSSSPYYPY